MILDIGVKKKKIKTRMNEEEINDGHYLELMDRLHVMGCNFETHILGHPLIDYLENKELMEQLHKVLEGVGEAYQIIGQLDYENNDT